MDNGHIMFLKLANSDTENGIKKIKNVSLKNSFSAETGKLEKTLFVIYKNTTVIRRKTNKKK